MLRWMVGIMLVLNGLFFAWSQHWLAPLGLQPLSEGEPARSQQQLRPNAIKLLPDTPENIPELPAAPVSAASAENTESSASAPEREKPTP